MQVLKAENEDLKAHLEESRFTCFTELLLYETVEVLDVSGDFTVNNQHSLWPILTAI